MKKYFILASVFILASCFGENSKIEDAKNKALSENNGKELVSNDNSSNSNEPEKTIESNETSTENTPYIKVENVSDEQIFTIPNLPTITTATRRFSIIGYIGGEYNVDKVVVTFSNETSDYPDDVHTLGAFNPGDSTFKYNAIKENYNVLDFGLNEYLVEAYIGEKVFSKKVIVFIPEMDSEDVNINYESKGFGTEENYQIVKFPENSSSFGSVIEMEDGIFGYSKIDGFIIQKGPGEEFSCSDTSVLSDYLIDRFGFVYWNSCVPLKSKNGLYVNILQLDGEIHKYFRYYIDTKNNLEGIKDLASGSGIVNKSNIGDQNKEFKGKDFSLDTGFSDNIFNLLSK